MDLQQALAWLERKGTRATRDGMARYGIRAKRAFGVPMGTLLKLKRELGTDRPPRQGGAEPAFPGIPALDRVVIPRDTPHGFTPTGNDPAIFLSVFTPPFVTGDRVFETPPR